MAKINLLLQLQRQKLLQENKERAGQNRSAKEDRSRTTKTADKASAPPAITPAAQAKQEEDARKKRQLSGGSLDLYKRRRPAATGEEEEYRVFGISNITPYDKPEKIENVSIPWTATYNRRIESIEGDGLYHYRWVNETKQRTNSYQVVEREWNIGFNEDFGNSTTFFSTPKHTLPGVITAFDWYFYQSNIGFLQQSVAGAIYHSAEKIIASTPQLSPHNRSWFDNRQTVETNSTPLTSSDGRYIYHSTFYVAGHPPPSFYAKSPDPVLLYDDTIFEPLNYPIFTNETTQINGLYYYGLKTHRILSDISTYYSYNYDDDPQFFRNVVGLYWRYDTQTPNAVPELRIENMSYGPGYISDSTPNVRSNFLNNLNPSDPYYKWWKFRYGTSNVSASRFLSSSIKNDSYLNWPPNLVYYPDTGQALFTKALNTGTPTVYSKTVAPGLETYQMMHYFPYLTQAGNSHENMLSNGWEVENFNTSSTAFLDPNFRVAHRAT